MKTLFVVATFQPVVDPDRLLKGRTVEQWLEEMAKRSLPGVPVAVMGPFSSAEQYIEDLRRVSETYDEVVLASSDAPFLRADLVQELLTLHRRYRADYTFADGLPGGLAPEILRPKFLDEIVPWAQANRAKVDRETLFQLLSTDINRFDIETYLSPVDLRSRRLSFYADSRRNWMLLERYATDSELELRSFLDTVEATQDRSRTLAATLQVQVTDGVLQVPRWSPLAQFAPGALNQRSFLPREVWNSWLDKALSWAGDLTVLPSFWGEPSLHPQILELLSDALAKPGLSLCLETSGLGWSRVDLESWSKTVPGKIDWVVELDSNVAGTYSLLRGEGFAEAQQFVERLIPLFPGRVWPQTVRMQENEAEMEAFHSHWKARAGQCIIQKHNDFGGRLPRSKPSDLSPWKRHPCWHLARDLAVFLNGDVVVCRDDFNRTHTLGNANDGDWSAIWNRGQELFSRHLRNQWPGVCQNCDEWYTFHF